MDNVYADNVFDRNIYKINSKMSLLRRPMNLIFAITFLNQDKRDVGIDVGSVNERYDKFIFIIFLT